MRRKYAKDAKSTGLGRYGPYGRNHATFGSTISKQRKEFSYNTVRYFSVFGRFLGPSCRSASEVKMGSPGTRFLPAGCLNACCPVYPCVFWVNFMLALGILRYCLNPPFSMLLSKLSGCN